MGDRCLCNTSARLPRIRVPGLLVTRHLVRGVNHNTGLIASFPKDVLLTTRLAIPVPARRIPPLRRELVRTRDGRLLPRAGQRAGGATRRRRVGVACPEAAVDHGSEDGDVDGDDADDGLADAPAVDVEGGRGAGEGEDDADECCRDDEDTRGEEDADDDFP